MKRPTEPDDSAQNDMERQRKMRRMARAKAHEISRKPSPTPSVQVLDELTEEERQEILKYVETEQTEVS